MDAIIRNVRDIETSERNVLEHVLGRQLKENQQVVIHVVTVGQDVAQTPVESDTAASDELPDCCNVYDGLTEEQITDLESVILERANRTRQVAHTFT